MQVEVKKGEFHEFPDDATPQEIEAALKKGGYPSMTASPQENPFVSGLRNIAAGALQFGKENAEPWAEVLSPLKAFLHPRNPNEMQPGQAINQTNTSLMHGTPQEEQLSGIDPYKIMGTKPAESLLSPEGIEQNAIPLAGALTGGYQLGKAGLKYLGKLINPNNVAKEFVSKTLEEIPIMHKEAESKQEAAYDIFNNQFGKNIVSVDPKNYLNIDRKDLKYIGPDAKKLLADFYNEPFAENLHKFKSQLGKDSTAMAGNSNKTYTRQAVNRVKDIAENKLLSSLEQNPTAKESYLQGTKISREEKFPFESTPKLGQIINESINPEDMSLKQLKNALTNATQKMKGKIRSVPENHYLHDVLSKVRMKENEINRLKYIRNTTRGLAGIAGAAELVNVLRGRNP
jgi:hypothetical protein